VELSSLSNKLEDGPLRFPHHSVLLYPPEEQHNAFIPSTIRRSVNVGKDNKIGKETSRNGKFGESTSHYEHIPPTRTLDPYCNKAGIRETERRGNRRVRKSSVRSVILPRDLISLWIRRAVWIWRVQL